MIKALVWVVEMFFGLILLWLGPIEGTSSFTIQESKQHFDEMTEKVRGIGDEFGYKTEVIEDEWEIDLSRENETIEMMMANSMKGLEREEEKGEETIFIYYTRENKSDKAFNLDLFTRLINSMSRREFTKNRCEKLLFSPDSENQMECMEEGEIENYVEHLDFFWENFCLSYEKYEESELTEKKEILFARAISNSK